MAYADFKDLLFERMGDTRGWTPEALAKALTCEEWDKSSPRVTFFRKLRYDARIRACRRAIRERGLELLAKVGSDFIRDRLREPSMATRLKRDSLWPREALNIFLNPLITGASAEQYRDEFLHLLVDVQRNAIVKTVELCIETVEARIQTAKACSYSESYIAGMEDILVFHKASLERVLRGDHFHPSTPLAEAR